MKATDWLLERKWGQMLSFGGAAAVLAASLWDPNGPSRAHLAMGGLLFANGLVLKALAILREVGLARRIMTVRLERS